MTSRAALEGERKQVTVLFADVKGSMELAEQVDAEEWHRILDRFFQILTDGPSAEGFGPQAGVHRFEGTVNQYTGDGIMALFGAPIAHEDHAHRACYATLRLGEELQRYGQDLKRERGLQFAVRIGLNEVVPSLVDQGVLRRTGSVGAHGRAPLQLARPITDIQVPPTVHVLLASRIHRLAERDKQVLQTAAVIGKEFAEPILQRVIADVGAHGGAPVSTGHRSTSDAPRPGGAGVPPWGAEEIGHERMDGAAHASWMDCCRSCNHGAACSP